MTISTQHHQARRRVVLQDSLMNDTSSWWPELDSVFLRSRFQKIKNLAITLDRLWKIHVGTSLAHNHMVAVNACRYGCGRETTRHELKQCHLSRCILHGYSVWLEFEICCASNVIAIAGVVEKRLLSVLEMGV